MYTAFKVHCSRLSVAARWGFKIVTGQGKKPRRPINLDLKEERTTACGSINILHNTVGNFWSGFVKPVAIYKTVK